MTVASMKLDRYEPHAEEKAGSGYADALARYKAGTSSQDDTLRTMAQQFSAAAFGKFGVDTDQFAQPIFELLQIAAQLQQPSTLADELQARLRKEEGQGWHPYAAGVAQIAADAIAALRSR